MWTSHDGITRIQTEEKKSNSVYLVGFIGNPSREVCNNSHSGESGRPVICLSSSCFLGLWYFGGDAAEYHVRASGQRGFHTTSVLLALSIIIVNKCNYLSI